ncbi:MAG: DUF4291 domain-containing protein [Planctomycetales bacterium]
MKNHREIRADHDRESIVVYQAYCSQIADAALQAGRFVAPFSLQRMTWIKPSFLWLMERSNWERKTNQERTLAVRITREGWEKALGSAELTNFQRKVHAGGDDWRRRFKQVPVHVQWDPERSLRGGKLSHRSIQVGITRRMIREFVKDWVVEIRDLTGLAQRVRRQLDEGRLDRAKRLLPPERVVSVDEDIRSRLGMNAL